jgi:hypothetical protein
VVLAVGEVADAGGQFQPRRDPSVAREKINSGVDQDLRGDEACAAAERLVGILPVLRGRRYRGQAGLAEIARRIGGNLADLDMDSMLAGQCFSCRVFLESAVSATAMVASAVGQVMSRSTRPGPRRRWKVA